MKDIIVEVRPAEVSDPEVLGGLFDLWLVDSDNDSSRRVLSTYSIRHELLFSPEERFIVITTYPAAEASQNDLFIRVKGLEYRYAGDIDNTMWDFFYRKRHGKKPALRSDLMMFTNRYVEPVRWMSNDELLLKVWGYDSTDQFKESDALMCTYNAATGLVRLQESS